MHEGAIQTGRLFSSDSMKRIFEARKTLKKCDSLRQRIDTYPRLLTLFPCPTWSPFHKEAYVWALSQSVNSVWFSLRTWEGILGLSSSHVSVLQLPRQKCWIHETSSHKSCTWLLSIESLVFASSSAAVQQKEEDPGTTGQFSWSTDRRMTRIPALGLAFSFRRDSVTFAWGAILCRQFSVIYTEICIGEAASRTWQSSATSKYI
jgi:hypothetical protein